MNLPRLHSVRARLSLLLLLVVVPTLGVIGYLIDTQRREALSQAEESARLFALSAQHAHDSLVASMRSVLRLLSYAPEIRTPSPQGCGAFLDTLLKRSREYENFGLIGPDGTLLCSALPFTPGTNMGDRAYFQEAQRTRGLTVSEYLVGRMTHTPVIVFAYPVIDQQDQSINGVLYASVSPRWISEQFQSMNMPSGSVMMVYDHGGMVLARFPPEERVLGTNAYAKVYEAALAQNATGTKTLVDEDGVRRLYAFSRQAADQKSLGTILAVGIPSASAFARVKEATYRSAMSLVVALVVVIGIGSWGTGALLVNPLRQLSVAAMRMRAGDLAARVDPTRHSLELSDLVASFNQMADAIEARDRTLQENVANLARLGRIRRMMSSINGAILRIRTTNLLIKEVCTIAVDEGGFKVAWIAMIDDSGLNLVVQAHAGAAPDSFRNLTISLSASSAQASPSRQAVNENRSIVWNQLGDFEEPGAWRTHAEQIGFRSIIALPLRIDDRVVGVLTLCAEAEYSFSDDEQKVLLEMAADTGIGLGYIEKSQKVEQLVYYDQLTGLANPALIEDRLAQGLARALPRNRHVAVVVLDIRHLREINDLYGRQVGDQAIRTVGAWLSGAVRSGDTVGRLGADDFAIVLVDIAQSADIPEILREMLDGKPNAVSAGNPDILLEVSIGVAVSPNDGSTPGDLLKHASAALNTAIAQNSPTFVFYSSAENIAAQENFAIARELRRAVPRSELRLVYQPIVEIPSRRVVGAEALLRWRSGSLGEVSPGRFIPIAEESDVICDIGAWVMQEAAKQCSDWIARSEDPFHVAVNVSARQLRSPDFCDIAIQSTMQLRDEVGWNPMYVEVTETSVMDDIDKVVQVLRSLKTGGFSISIDDFGTGYSSMSRLRALPLNVLKIDLSFIRDLERDESAVAVTRSIIALGQALGLDVLAEGVETEGQARILTELGCDLAQGYLFSKPLPPEEFATLLS